jgi:hypothetical protein
MRAQSCVLWISATLFLGGCGGSDDPAEINLANGCNITERACQHAIFQVTAEVRGQPNAPMPEVRTISLDEFTRSLAPDNGSSTEPDVWSAVMPLLGLLPAGSSVADQSAAAAIADVAAYYDDKTKRVTVIDRGSSDPRDDLFVLSHEFAHSLQDAAIGLDAFRNERASSLDSLVALTSLVEGEANVLGLVVLGRTLGQSPAMLNWTRANAALRSDVFASIESSPAPLVTAVQGLPYVLGTAQLSALWLGSGQPAIEALYAGPPSSVLDWAEDTRVTAGTRIEALDCLPSAGPPGFTGYDLDSLGPTGLLTVALDGGASIAQAWTDALGLRGDRVVAFAEDGVSDSYAIAWRIRFASAPAAKSFADGVSRRLAAGAAVAIQDREVVYFGTTNPDKLALWTDPTHCGTEDELPARHVEPPAEEASLRHTWRALRGR